MQRYFLPANGTIGDKVWMAEQDIHHISTVMRSDIGDQLIVNFTNGSFMVEITDLSGGVEVRIIEALDIDVELPVHVAILSGLLKNDKYEWMIQKATELGASTFYPYQADRSVTKWDNKAHKKLERLGKIVKEAAEQSYRQVVPDIQFVESRQAAEQLTAAYDHVIIAYEESAKNGEQSALVDTFRRLKAGDRVLMIFGPEGGLSDKEIEQFNGIKAALGPRILRAETAPLYALAALSYQLELTH